MLEPPADVVAARQLFTQQITDTTTRASDDQQHRTPDKNLTMLTEPPEPAKL